MQKRISYDIAKIYNKLGYDEPSDYLYCNLTKGLRIVKGDIKQPVGERIYYIGDLIKADEDWGITYPSSYWIPAPFIFDIVLWIEYEMEIFIIPNFENKKWTYEFMFSDYSRQLGLEQDLNNKLFTSFNDIYKSNNEQIKNKYSKTLQYCYNNAVTEIALIADKNNWVNKLYKYI